VTQTEEKEEEKDEDDGFLEDIDDDEDDEDDEDVVAAQKQSSRERELQRLRVALRDAEIYGTEIVDEQAEEKTKKPEAAAHVKEAHVTVLFPGSEATFGAPHVLLTRGALVDVANRVLDRFRVSHLLTDQKS
jgi:hypothetical protein